MNKTLKNIDLYNINDDLLNHDKGWGYIYEIRNIINDYVYIGSAFSFKQRWKSHINSLDNKTHGNKYLQNAWNKYGRKNFKFTVLLSVFSQDVLKMIEQDYLNRYFLTSKNKIYNINKTTYGGFTGRKHSLETKKIMSEKRIGVSLTKKEKNPNAKLNLQQVNEIRLNLEKNSLIELGRKYNVTYQTISGIIKYKTWKIND